MIPPAFSVFFPYANIPNPMNTPQMPVAMHPKLNRKALRGFFDMPMSERESIPNCHAPSVAADEIHMIAKKTGAASAT